MRLGTELRATRRGWPGDPEVTLAGSPLAPVHCCLHQVEALTITGPSVSPAGPQQCLQGPGSWGRSLCGHLRTWSLPGSRWGVLLLPAPGLLLNLPDIPGALSPFLSVPSPKPMRPAWSLGDCRTEN